MACEPAIEAQRHFLALLQRLPEGTVTEKQVNNDMALYNTSEGRGYAHGADRIELAKAPRLFGAYSAAAGGGVGMGGGGGGSGGGGLYAARTGPKNSGDLFSARHRRNNQVEMPSLNQLASLLNAVNAKTDLCVTDNDYAVTLYRLLDSGYDLNARLSQEPEETAATGRIRKKLAEADGEAATLEDANAIIKKQRIEVAFWREECERLKTVPAALGGVRAAVRRLRRCAEDLKQTVRYQNLDSQDLVQQYAKTYKAYSGVDLLSDAKVLEGARGGDEDGGGSAAGANGLSIVRQQELSKEMADYMRQADPFRDAKTTLTTALTCLTEHVAAIAGRAPLLEDPKWESISWSDAVEDSPENLRKKKAIPSLANLGKTVGLAPVTELPRHLAHLGTYTRVTPELSLVRSTATACRQLSTVFALVQTLCKIRLDLTAELEECKTQIIQMHVDLKEAETKGGKGGGGGGGGGGGSRGGGTDRKGIAAVVQRTQENGRARVRELCRFAAPTSPAALAAMGLTAAGDGGVGGADSTTAFEEGSALVGPAAGGKVTLESLGLGGMGLEAGGGGGGGKDRRKSASHHNASPTTPAGRESPAPAPASPTRKGGAANAASATNAKQRPAGTRGASPSSSNAPSRSTTPQPQNLQRQQRPSIRGSQSLSAGGTSLNSPFAMAIAPAAELCEAHTQTPPLRRAVAPRQQASGQAFTDAPPATREGMRPGTAAGGGEGGAPPQHYPTAAAEEGFSDEGWVFSPDEEGARTPFAYPDSALQTARPPAHPSPPHQHLLHVTSTAAIGTDPQVPFAAIVELEVQRRLWALTAGQRGLSDAEGSRLLGQALEGEAAGEEGHGLIATIRASAAAAGGAPLPLAAIASSSPNPNHSLLSMSADLDALLGYKKSKKGRRNKGGDRRASGGGSTSEDANERRERRRRLREGVREALAKGVSPAAVLESIAAGSSAGVLGADAASSSSSDDDETFAVVLKALSNTQQKAAAEANLHKQDEEPSSGKTSSRRHRHHSGKGQGPTNKAGGGEDAASRSSSFARYDSEGSSSADGDEDVTEEEVLRRMGWARHTNADTGAVTTIIRVRSNDPEQTANPQTATANSNGPPILGGAGGPAPIPSAGQAQPAFVTIPPALVEAQRQLMADERRVRRLRRMVKKKGAGKAKQQTAVGIGADLPLSPAAAADPRRGSGLVATPTRRRSSHAALPSGIASAAASPSSASAIVLTPTAQPLRPTSASGGTAPLPLAAATPTRPLSRPLASSSASASAAPTPTAAMPRLAPLSPIAPITLTALQRTQQQQQQQEGAEGEAKRAPTAEESLKKAMAMMRGSRMASDGGPSLAAVARRQMGGSTPPHKSRRSIALEGQQGSQVVAATVSISDGSGGHHNGGASASGGGPLRPFGTPMPAANGAISASDRRAIELNEARQMLCALAATSAANPFAGGNYEVRASHQLVFSPAVQIASPPKTMQGHDGPQLRRIGDSL